MTAQLFPVRHLVVVENLPRPRVITAPPIRRQRQAPPTPKPQFIYTLGNLILMGVAGWLVQELLWAWLIGG
jgi:hypothetical protein